MRSLVSTLGPAEVIHIFVHDATALLKNVPRDARTRNSRSYDQRALLMARPHDVVCMSSPSIDPSFAHFLSERGIGPRSNNIIQLDTASCDEECTISHLLCRCPVLLHDICERVATAKRVVLNPYSVSDDVHILAKELEKVLGKPVMVLGGNPRIAASANRKHVTFRRAQLLDIPVAPGEVVEWSHSQSENLAMLRSAIRRQVEKTGRVIIRGADGISGSDTFTVEKNMDSREQVLGAISRTPHSSVYLVQVLHEIVASPNILVFVEPDDGGVEVVSVSDQRLNRHLKHVGNIAPSIASTLADMVRSAESYGRWLQSEGFTGLVGFDFVDYADPESGKSQYLLAEINARANGATYPGFLMEHLNARQFSFDFPTIGAYLSALVPLRAQSFAEFLHNYDTWLFNPRTGRGIIPYAICRETMCCNMAFLGPSRNEVEAMHQAFLSQ
ncbi:MAG: hypothetical protein H0X47_06085 [Nitrospirales bacterium]|nr:hypothetical protein [Nitrospirales bacterium]